MASGFLAVVILVPVFLFCLCLHEFAHAWVAYQLGDSSARDQGRLTLHPLAHADMVGTLLLPTVCIYYGLPFFGWAKPVPVDVRNFKHPRRDMALVAAAGPASNLLLAGIAALVLGGAVRTEWVVFGSDLSSIVQVLALVSIQVNLFLAVFNLLPIPPLDGFNILQAFIPLRWAAWLYRFSPASSVLLLVLLLSGGLRYLGMPVTHLYRTLVQWVT